MVWLWVTIIWIAAIVVIIAFFMGANQKRYPRD